MKCFEKIVDFVQLLAVSSSVPHTLHIHTHTHTHTHTHIHIYIYTHINEHTPHKIKIEHRTHHTSICTPKNILRLLFIIKSIIMPHTHTHTHTHKHGHQQTDS